MKKKDKYIKGSELKIGMTVQRFSGGLAMNHPMIVFASGPYYKNPLYADDNFKVIHDVDLGAAAST